MTALAELNNNTLYVRADLAVGDTIALPGMPRCRVLRVYRSDENNGRSQRVLGVNLCCLDTMTFLPGLPCGELLVRERECICDENVEIKNAAASASQKNKRI